MVFCVLENPAVMVSAGLGKYIKRTVQRKLRGVKLYISRFVSLWAVVALLWFCQEYSRHFEIHEIQFSAI